jgi:hypothetical protein
LAGNRLQAAQMSIQIPTRVGDVLIVRTKREVVLRVVGLVTKDGQSELQGEANVSAVPDDAAAVLKANALLMPGKRVFIHDIDRGVWAEIAI